MMNESKVRIGIIGCANVARKRALPAMQHVTNGEIVAISSRYREKAQEWAQEFNIEWSGTYDQLLENKNVDAVYIPLPIGLHEEWVIKAARAGKHIICEKSLSGDFESVRRMIDACRQNNVVLFENFMCDYHPQHQKAIDLIKEGKIGDAFIFKSYFGFPSFDKDSYRYSKELGGGSLNDAGAYTIFMGRKIFGEVFAVTATLNLDPNAQESSSAVDIQGTIQLEFKDGKIGLVAFGFDNVYQNNYSIWGQKGLVSVDRAYSIPENLDPPMSLFTNENFQSKTESIQVAAANQFALIFQDFCRTILEKDDLLVHKLYSQIETQAQVMQAVRMSAAQKRRVEAKEIARINESD